MKHQRHFDPNDASREMARISALISDLDRVVRILDSDIETEEERARVSNRFSSAYPIIARTQAARRDNLKETIAALERRLADRPDEVELVRLMAAPNNT
jgi:hypothetical protein